jgi:hypothetical protein
VPIEIGALALYALASWIVLRLFFERAKPFVNLGTLFLALDIPAFVWVIYQTGGSATSWLFFLLYIRVADQTNTTFKRAITFSHTSRVAGYLLLICIWLRRAPSDLVVGRSVQAAHFVRRQPVWCP